MRAIARFARVGPVDNTDVEVEGAVKGNIIADGGRGADVEFI